MKKIIYITLIFATMFLTSCNQEEEITENSTEINIEILEEVTQIDHIEMQYDKGPSARFMMMPLYFQQDYAEVEIENHSLAEKGSLITALSMIYSYGKSEYVTPDIFIKLYDVKIDGSNKIDIMSQMSKDMYGIQDESYAVTVEPFDAEKLAYYLHNIRTYVLVRIPHPSIYGELSSYVIVTGTTENGDLIIRDPNQENIENLASFKEYNEPVYPSFDFCVAAGNKAEMYIFGNYKEYEAGVGYDE